MGLEVKYPSNWNLFGDKGDTWTGFSPLTLKQRYEIDARGTNYFPSFDIVKLKAYENMDEDPLIYQKKSLEELFSNRYVTYSITESEIGGLPAILVITTSNHGEQVMYWAVGDDKRYNISYDIPSGEEDKYKDIFQEMVDSFSFSDQ